MSAASPGNRPRAGRQMAVTGSVTGNNMSQIPKNIQVMDPELQDPPSAGPQAGAIIAEAIATESDTLRAKLAEQKDLNRRLVADFANFRRRTRQDAERQALAHKESFIHELLPALDNLERALASGASPDSRQFLQGVELTVQQLRQLLRRHGIETQESAGRPFDPHLHEAVSQRHDPAQPEHAILDVLQRGYRRGEKVFRPAKVVVNGLAAS
jgi:molecular chaperone GrpE